MTDHTTQNLWKLEAWFPSHCGTPVGTKEFFYGADTIEDAIRFHQEEYAASTVRSCIMLGLVQFKGEVKL